MDQFDAAEFITRLFLRVRRQEYGFRLGIGEYRSALDAVEQGFVPDEAALLEMVQALWCSSRHQQEKVERAWEAQVKALQQDKKLGREDLGLASGGKTSEGDRSDNTKSNEPIDLSSSPGPIELERPPVDLSTVPVQAPRSTFDEDESLQLSRYYPVSRRSMIYGWRMLRRIVADGARVVLDMPGTIAARTERGYYLGPVYQRRRRNDARLVLLLDQNGSMMPFHRFTRDLVETAQQESRLAEENIQVFYFHNVPGESLYRDLYLTEPVEFQDLLASCDGDTAVLVVSDAGAAEGAAAAGADSGDDEIFAEVAAADESGGLAQSHVEAALGGEFCGNFGLFGADVSNGSGGLWGCGIGPAGAGDGFGG
ncbi:MAG: VWA domain-containing protein [Alkalinema sp. RU_4_3]|nr:VWA domain-containing protein [Alkalinema sp. RU_4_3]